MKQVLFSFAFVLLFTASSIAQSYQVVANINDTEVNLSKKEISQIFLKNIIKWDDGTKIVPVDLSIRSEIRAEFSEEIHGRAVNAIRSFWQQAAFSGAGTAPIEKSTDEEVIAFIKKNPGAIGYVSANTEVEGLVVLNVL